MAESHEEVIGMVVKLAAESTDFQNQMSTLNRQMKVLQSDYKATASSSKDFENTMDGMAAKSAYLSNALKTQQSIVEAHSTRLEKSKQRLADLADAQIQLKSKLDSTKSSYEEAVRLHGEESEEAQKLASELKELQAQYDKNNDKVNALSRTIDNQTISYNNARSTLNNLEGQLRETEQAMEQMGNASDDVSNNMNNLQGTGNPFSNLTSGIKDAVGETKIFGVSLSDIGGALAGTVSPASLMTGAVAGITSALANMIVQGIQRAIEAIGQLIVSMVTTGNEFYAQVSRVQAISGATGAAAQGLNDLARELGRNTVYSATEAAKALEYAALAGWKLEDMASGMPGILNLAAASGEDLALVSDIVTDQLTAFGMATSEAGHMADVMAAAMSNSNTNVEQLGKALEYCGPLAGQAGFSIEDVSLAIGLMASSSIKGEKAGTALRKLFTEMPSNLTVTSSAFGEMEIATVNADGSFRSLKDIIIDLREAFSQMTESERLLNSESIAAKTGMSGLATMVNTAESEFNKLADAITNSAGASAAMAETMTNNVSGQITLLKSKMESIGLSIYSMFEPILLQATKWINVFMRGIDVVVGYVSKAISTVVGFISPITDVFIAIATTIQDIAITFLDPVIQALTQKSTNILNTLRDLASAIVPVIKNIGEAITPFVTVVANTLAALINVISGNFKDAWKNIQTVFEQGAKDTEKEAVKHADAMAKIAAEGEDETTSTVKSGCLDKYEKLKETYEEIEAETSAHYDNLKLMAQSYANNLTANEEAYEKWKSDKMNEWEKKYEKMHDTSTLNGLKRLEQARAKQEALLDQQIERDRAREETVLNDKLQVQKQYIDETVKLYEEGTQNQTQAVESSIREQKSLWESLCDSINRLFGKEQSTVVSIGGSKIPGYEVGTNNHPGGLAIVGERGPELANLPKGTSVSTNGDTATLLKNANSDVVSELSILVNEVRGLKTAMNQNARYEAAMIGLK